MDTRRFENPSALSGVIAADAKHVQADADSSRLGARIHVGEPLVLETRAIKEGGRFVMRSMDVRSGTLFKGPPGRFFAVFRGM